MDTPTTTADELCREMRQVRSSLDEDVTQVVQNTRVLTDWRHYVRSAPWWALGTAAVAGYLLVPSRPRIVAADPSQFAGLVKERQLVLADRGSAKTQKSTGEALGAMIAGIFVRTALGFATKRLEQFLSGPRSGSGSAPVR